MTASVERAPSEAPLPPGGERLPLGALVLGPDLRIVSADDAFCRVFVCRRDELEGRSLEDFLSPDDRRAIMTLHTGLSRHGGGLLDLPTELRVGSAAYHARLRVGRAGAGWVVYVERIQDQDLVYQLLLARERWSAIFQSSQDGIVVLSPTSRIVELNHRFYELIQFRTPHGILLNEDAMVGRPILQLLPQVGLDSIKLAIEQPQVREASGSVTIGGRQLEFALSRLALPVRGVVGTCIVVRDVSERRQLEELRIKHAESHYAGMAEVANNLLHNLGNMCGSVLYASEELLKTLQSSVIGRVQRAGAMLAEHSEDLPRFLTSDPKGQLLPEFYLRAGEALEAERTRLADLAQELVGKVQLIKDAIAAQQTYAKGTRFIESIDLDVVVNDALGIERTAFERHGVRLSREGGSVGNVRAQRSKLVHVLLNVMRNAIDAMDGRAGDRLLVVETGRGADGRAFVRIRDNGKGIEPEQLSRLFTHGFTTKKTGHGFGLHFCALAMEEMRGTIRAESDGPGKGSAFVIGFAPDESARDEAKASRGR